MQKSILDAALWWHCAYICKNQRFYLLVDRLLTSASHLGAHTFCRHTQAAIYTYRVFQPDIFPSGFPHGFVFPTNTCTCAVSLGAGHFVGPCLDFILDRLPLRCLYRKNKWEACELREKEHISSKQLLHFGAQIVCNASRKSPSFTTCQLPTVWQLIHKKQTDLG